MLKAVMARLAEVFINGHGSELKVRRFAGVPGSSYRAVYTRTLRTSMIVPIRGVMYK